MGNNRWREVDSFRIEAGGRNGRFTKGLAVKGAGERAEGPDLGLEGRRDLRSWTVGERKRLGRGTRVVE